MNHPTLLLLLLAIQHALYGGAWWIGARLLSLSRTAALHWTGFCACTTVGLLLFVESFGLPDLWLMLLRNVSLVLACMLVRRGVACFMRRPPADVEQVGLMLVFVLGLLWMGPGESSLPARSAWLAMLLSWLLLRLALEQQQAIGQEFGRLTGAVLAVPPALVALMLGARAVMSATGQASSAELQLTEGTTLNNLLLFSVVVLSSVFQFTLLYMVVLRLVAKLRHLSRHDPLTGLLNRRAWSHALALERLHLRRRPRSLGLLMVDIDHFKQLNDHLGHAAGDAALCAVASTLQSVARGTDVVARLGGEEFGMLLIDTDVQGAAQAAERVRAAVARLPFTHEDRELPMTVSVGAAVLTAEVASSMDADALVALADAALYRAKAAGRNRVVVQTAPGEMLMRAV